MGTATSSSVAARALARAAPAPAPPPLPPTPLPLANPPPPPPVSAAAAPSTDSGKKRKQRKAAVTEDEDIAIFKAIAMLKPHCAPWGQIRKRWQQVVDTVTAEVGEHREITVMLCQRRYEKLLGRFSDRQHSNRQWSSELRVLLAVALDERTKREASAADRVASSVAAQSPKTLDAFQAAVRVAMKDPKLLVKQESADADSESVEDGEVHDESPTTRYGRSHPGMEAVSAAPASPTGRRSFVESTLVAVLDRLAGIEKTWAENDREERELRRQQLEYEREAAHKIPEEKADGRASPPAEHEDTTPGTVAESTTEVVEPPTESSKTRNEKEPAMSVAGPRQDAVPRVEPVATRHNPEYPEIKKYVAILTASLINNTQQQFLLNQQVATLTKGLKDVSQENEVLQQDVAALQAMLRDASSLAGTLKVLRDAHQQHEQYFQSHVVQQDARIETLEREIKESLQSPIQSAETTTSAEKLATSIQREQDHLQVDYQKRLVELDANATLLVGPIGELTATVEKQQDQLKQLEQTDASKRAEDAKTEQTIQELKTAIETERSERHDAYGALVQTIERVVASRTEPK